jgi:hypothetical protein
MGSLPNDKDVPRGRILTLYICHVQQYCSSVHDIKRNQCRIFHVAEYSLLLGVKLQEPPLEIGRRRDVLKKYGLLGHA